MWFHSVSWLQLLPWTNTHNTQIFNISPDFSSRSRYSQLPVGHIHLGDPWLLYLFILNKFIFIFGCVGSPLVHAGFLQLRRAGATPRGPLLAAVRGPPTEAASSAAEHRLQARGPQQSWRTGLAAPPHVGPSRTRARTRVPRIGRQTPNHCATREAPPWLLYIHHVQGRNHHHSSRSTSPVSPRQRMCISNKAPDDADAASSGPIFWESLLKHMLPLPTSRLSGSFCYLLDHDIYAAGTVHISQHSILLNLDSCNIAF